MNTAFLAVAGSTPWAPAVHPVSMRLANTWTTQQFTRISGKHRQKRARSTRRRLIRPTEVVRWFETIQRFSWKAMSLRNVTRCGRTRCIAGRNGGSNQAIVVCSNNIFAYASAGPVMPCQAKKYLRGVMWRGDQSPRNINTGADKTPEIRMHEPARSLCRHRLLVTFDSMLHRSSVLQEQASSLV